MDELELLKKQWQRKDEDLPHLSYGDIYKMLLKKSSSIVKWILFISIGEIIFWTSLAFMMPESSRKFTEDIGLHNAMITINILYYIFFASFIFLFYKNYLKISTTDSIRELMKNILRTRKTVKYFIIYNVVSTCIMFIGINMFYYFNQDLMFEIMIRDNHISATTDKEQFLSLFFITQLVVAVLIVAGILIFYRVVYGILLKRLYTNYQELKKIEM